MINSCLPLADGAYERLHLGKAPTAMDESLSGYSRWLTLPFAGSNPASNGALSFCHSEYGWRKKKC